MYIYDIERKIWIYKKDDTFILNHKGEFCCKVEYWYGDLIFVIWKSNM